MSCMVHVSGKTEGVRINAVATVSVATAWAQEERVLLMLPSSIEGAAAATERVMEGGRAMAAKACIKVLEMVHTRRPCFESDTPH